MLKANNYLLLILFFGLVTFAQNPPVANQDVDTVDFNTTLTVNAPGLLENDTDPDAGDTLIITEFTIDNVNYTNAGQPLTIPGIGVLTIFADGSYEFIPDPSYDGTVPNILYYISDDDGNTSFALLLLTVEMNISDPDIDLLEIISVASCNQGYISPSADFPNGAYRIRYNVTLRNNSIARDKNPLSLVTNIDLVNNINSVFDNCVISVGNPTHPFDSSPLESIGTSNPDDFINDPYSQDWVPLSNAINQDFQDLTSATFFSSNAITNNVLYPRQTINFSYCINIDPACASTNPIDYDNLFEVTFQNGDGTIGSTNGSDSFNLKITDFHTSQTTVAAGLVVPEVSPDVEPNGTYDFTNTVVITNDGNAIANNVNFNMGLGNFLDRPVGANNIPLTFQTITITQTSGPSVTVNGTFDGDINTLLLQNGNSLNSGESIELEINYIVNPIESSDFNSSFSRLNTSMTQGPTDFQGEGVSPSNPTPGAITPIDESTNENKRIYSYVVWNDTQGNHLDTYYSTLNPSSDMQCQCDVIGMTFLSVIDLTIVKSGIVTDPAPNGIVEHEEVIFELIATNNSPFLQVENIQIVEDLNAICNGNIISVSNLEIDATSTALILPTLNNNFDGITNTNIFNNGTGVLEPSQNVIVRFTVVFNEDCIGENFTNGGNIAIFSGNDPLSSNLGSVTSNTVIVNVFSDTDNDGITNLNDIDDDNDGIPDTEEYNGLDPLADDDLDTIPNYRDTDFGNDNNGDNIIDIFDFDFDGVPNHFDLDSDNDGVFDIVESGLNAVDIDNNGMTDSPVGVNGLDDFLESDDTITATLLGNLLNTDSTGNDNYLDIDADDDGIVDIIEAQDSFSYDPPNNTVNINGIDSAYPNGLLPIDTDGDDIPDYLDEDSDEDLREDRVEGWDTDNDGITNTNPSNTDNDNDGLDDNYDTDTSQINPTNGQVPTDFPNLDKPSTPELDWREIITIFVVIDSPIVVEGNDLVFTISLENSNGLPIVIGADIDLEIFTSDGAVGATEFEIATNVEDYVGIPNTPTLITIPALQTSTTVSPITTFDDVIFELSERLTLNGTITSSNTENIQITGIGTIEDNELPPNITMNIVTGTVNEGEQLEYSISIDGPSSVPIDIFVQSSDVTTIVSDDYTEFSSTLTIPGTIVGSNPNTSVNFQINTILDAVDEQDVEELKVDGVVTNGIVTSEDLLDRSGFIVDLQLSTVVIDNPIVVEGESLIFTIGLVDVNGDPIANFADVNLNVFSNDDTADQPDDYISFSSALVIPAGETSITVEVLTIDDILNEETETMTLTAVINSGLVSNDPPIVVGIGSIKDNDIPNLFSPNDDNQSDFFEIAGLDDFPNFDIQIFDRWGSEVFLYSNNGNLNPLWWDGKNKGEPVPEGVYYYILNFNENNTKSKTGFIQLIR